MKIERIGVLGGGAMGSGIAEVCAKSNKTVLVEASDELAEKTHRRIEASLQRALGKEKITQAEYDSILGNLSFEASIDTLADCDLVIEAISEDSKIKLDVFQKLDKVLKPSAILASNTSSIPIALLTSATKRGEQVLGVHFFNPVPIMELVEIIPAEKTSPEVVDLVTNFVEQKLGKQTISVKDRAGFLVNRLLIPYSLGAISALESGLATRDDIDKGMRLGCSHPMGPLELADFVGLDILLNVADVLFNEFGSEQYKAPSLLKRMVESGKLGRKTGSGFYDY